jgi:hypothetical protein
MKEAMFIFDQLVINEPKFQFEELNNQDNIEIKSVEKSSLKKTLYDMKLYTKIQQSIYLIILKP